jgi:hypothetical protein
LEQTNEALSLVERSELIGRTVVAID